MEYYFNSMAWVTFSTSVSSGFNGSGSESTLGYGNYSSEATSVPFPRIWSLVNDNSQKFYGPAPGFPNGGGRNLSVFRILFSHSSDPSGYFSPLSLSDARICLLSSCFPLAGFLLLLVAIGVIFVCKNFVYRYNYQRLTVSCLFNPFPLINTFLVHNLYLPCKFPGYVDQCILCLLLLLLVIVILMCRGWVRRRIRLLSPVAGRT